MIQEVELRPLGPEDAGGFEEAFDAIGWEKPASLFEGYLREQTHGARTVVVAEIEGELAGYVTIVWEAQDPGFRARGIPEIVDLNVLPRFRRMGIGSLLLADAEEKVSRRSKVVGLGVGLHRGYGAAQRLYVKRGYIPDGMGVVMDGVTVAEEARVELNDSLVLRLTKDLPGVRRTGRNG